MRILLPLIALSACSASDTGTTTRSFPVPGAFDTVTLGGPDNVRVVTGSAPSIVATGRSRDLDKIEIELRGSELVVTRESGLHIQFFQWGTAGRDVTVTVTVPKPIAGATLKGSGDFAIDQGGGNRFEATLKGSGNLTVARVMAQAARLSLSGSGDLKAAGQVKSAEIDLSGSGGIDARDLAADTADIELRGSGEIRARASQSAKVALKGSGDVTVRGTGNCTIDKRGSGEVRCEP